jgi:hypothetical protein
MCDAGDVIDVAVPASPGIAYGLKKAAAAGHRRPGPAAGCDQRRSSTLRADSPAEAPRPAAASAPAPSTRPT